MKKGIKGSQRRQTASPNLRLVSGESDGECLPEGPSPDTDGPTTRMQEKFATINPQSQVWNKGGASPNFLLLD